MKKLISKLNKEYIIIACIVIISLFPLYFPGFLYTHDGIIHLFRTNGMYENLMNFDFFNRIYYNCLNDFGYGWGLFYPPLSALIPAVFMTLGISLFTSEKIFIVLVSILAGIFSFKLFKELFKDKFIAMIVAILYILCPYKINQVIIRGAMGEVLLYTFLPLVFLGLHKILNKEFKYSYLFIIGICGIVYAHIISVVYTTIFGLLFLLFNYKKLFNKKVIINLITSSIIIILISLPIIIPVVQHQFSGIYRISNIETDVADRVVHPGQLIGGSFEGKEAENTGYYSDEKEMNYMIGLAFLPILLLIPYLYKIIKKNGDLNFLIIYSILTAITIIMMVCTFFWNKFTILDVIQYPWRLLVFTTLFISIMCGYILKVLVNKDNRYIFFIFIISYSLLFVLAIGSKANHAKNLGGEFNFSNQELNPLIDDYGSLSFSIGFAHEYLPKNASEDYIIDRSNELIILNGSCEISNTKFDKNVLTSDLKCNKTLTQIEVPLLYYKGYTILLNDKKIDYHLSDNGFIKIIIDEKYEGDYHLKIKYTGTILYNICDIIAIITLILYLSYILINYVQGRKKHDKNYNK